MSSETLGFLQLEDVPTVTDFIGRVKHWADSSQADLLPIGLLMCIEACSLSLYIHQCADIRRMVRIQFIQFSSTRQIRFILEDIGTPLARFCEVDYAFISVSGRINADRRSFEVTNLAAQQDDLPEDELYHRSFNLSVDPQFLLPPSRTVITNDMVDLAYGILLLRSYNQLQQIFRRVFPPAVVAPMYMGTRNRYDCVAWPPPSLGGRTVVVGRVIGLGLCFVSSDQHAFDLEGGHLHAPDLAIYPGLFEFLREKWDVPAIEYEHVCCRQSLATLFSFFGGPSASNEEITTWSYNPHHPHHEAALETVRLQLKYFVRFLINQVVTFNASSAFVIWEGPLDESQFCDEYSSAMRMHSRTHWVSEAEVFIQIAPANLTLLGVYQQLLTRHHRPED